MTETISAPLDGILARIRYRPTGANAIEARIAAAILEDPGRVSHESITSFCSRTCVSAGSVVRFTKLMGLDGYRELKLALVQTTGHANGLQMVEVAPSRFRAAMDEQIRAMFYALEETEPAVIEKAAALLARARRIDIVAAGASVAVAQSLLFSLTLVGQHARFLPDSSEQGAAAAFIGPGDVLLAVSFSGRTRSIVDAASRAMTAGASVVAMTCNHRSPLMKSATVPVVIDANRGRFAAEWPLRTAMTAVARALSLAVADCLPADELKQRRRTWTSGRFGIRYDAN